MFDKILSIPLNSVTASQEPLFSYISTGICLYGFASGFTFTVTVNIKVLTTLSEIHYKITQIHKVLIKIHYGVVSFFLRDIFIVESS